MKPNKLLIDEAFKLGFIKKYPLTPNEAFKQETLEEVADKHAKDFPKGIRDLKKVVETFKRSSFITGFKKAEEIMYTEEEVIDLLKALQIGYYIHNERVDIEKWFEQFKK